MRADRLLSILLLLQSHRRLTAKELARRLEVSARTIHRDMEALGASGVPITSERGTGGGWSLIDGYRTDLTGLNASEVDALFLTRPSRLLADLKLDRASEAGLIKLLAALPAVSRRGAELVQSRIHIDVAGWNRPEESVPLLSTLQEAVWRDLRLRISYRRGGDCAVERMVDPLGLVAKGSVWYLVAQVEGDVRSYRASRIERAETLDESFARPLDFDLAAFWERSTSTFKESLPRYLVTARAAPEILGRLGYGVRFAKVLRIGETDARGWAEVELCFDAEEVACEYALGWGPRFEITSPPVLSEKLEAQARGIVDLYASREKGLP